MIVVIKSEWWLLRGYCGRSWMGAIKVIPSQFAILFDGSG